MNTKGTFIIAELSANHGGSIDIAIETIRAMKRAGADAVKLQTYTADTITLDCKTPIFQIGKGTKWEGQYFHDLYKEASLPWEWHERLFAVAKEEGLVCFSSPFDKTAVDFLEELDAPIYKIASFEITDIGLIEYTASKGKPMIMSTGIAEIEDIELAIETCKKAGNEDITILKCTSAYPAEPHEANLLSMVDLAQRFNVKVGLSDHTMGVEAPSIAVALGAKVIEKHFILRKDIGGPDAHFSLDEAEFKEMVDAVRKIELMLGKKAYELNDKSKLNRNFSRSLFIVKDVQKGEKISVKNVRSIRPGIGLHPKKLNDIMGMEFKDSYKKGTPLSEDYLS